MYSFGPDAHTFKDCRSGHEYWAADSSKQLELQYSQLVVDKAYTEVYVELEDEKVKAGSVGKGTEYDSTLVVTKLIKISKAIPEDMCN